MTELWAALISGGVTLAVCLVSNHAQAEKTRALLEYRLGQLEQQVARHNRVVERTFRLECDTEVIQEQIRVANHRIKDLEQQTRNRERTEAER